MKWLISRDGETQPGGGGGGGGALRPGGKFKAINHPSAYIPGSEFLSDNIFFYKNQLLSMAQLILTVPPVSI